jgi:preprotein translocase subunit SecE
LGRTTWAFIGNTRTEVRKVVWPTRAETVQTTLAVLFVVVLMGVVLWLMDMVLLWAIRLLTGQGG